MTAPDTAALVAWIAAGEEVARAAGESGAGWESYEMPDPGPNRWRMTGVGVAGDEMGHRTETMFPADAAHIALHDPAHELAVYAAIRAVVELHEAIPHEGHDAFCGTCMDPYPCPTLRALASLADGGHGQ